MLLFKPASSKAARLGGVSFEPKMARRLGIRCPNSSLEGRVRIGRNWYLGERFGVGDRKVGRRGACEVSRKDGILPSDL